MPLNIFKSADQTFMLMQKQWTSQLNPLLANMLTQGSVLTNISLKSGATTFNHYLGRLQAGWILTDQNAASSIYRSEPFNAQNLTLTSSNACVVSLWVF